jgi:hypothetical protein
MPTINRRSTAVAGAAVLACSAVAGLGYRFTHGPDEVTGSASVVQFMGVTSGLAPGTTVAIQINYRNRGASSVTTSEGVRIHVNAADPLWPVICDPKQFSVIDATGMMTFDPDMTSFLPLPAHNGGLLTWFDADPAQTTCLNALDAIGGVPLTFSVS